MYYINVGYIYKIYLVILSDQSNKFFDVKVVCLLKTKHHKQQVFKTLTLGSYPLNSHYFRWGRSREKEERERKKRERKRERERERREREKREKREEKERRERREKERREKRERKREK